MTVDADGNITAMAPPCEAVTTIRVSVTDVQMNITVMVNVTFW